MAAFDGKGTQRRARSAGSTHTSSGCVQEGDLALVLQMMKLQQRCGNLTALNREASTT